MSFKEGIKRLFESSTARCVRLSTEPFICPNCGKLGKYADLKDREMAVYGYMVNLVCSEGHRWGVEDPLKPTRDMF